MFSYYSKSEFVNREVENIVEKYTRTKHEYRFSQVFSYEGNNHGRVSQATPSPSRSRLWGSDEGPPFAIKNACACA